MPSLKNEINDEKLRKIILNIYHKNQYFKDFKYSLIGLKDQNVNKQKSDKVAKTGVSEISKFNTQEIDKLDRSESSVRISKRSLFKKKSTIIEIELPKLTKIISNNKKNHNDFVPINPSENELNNNSILNTILIRYLKLINQCFESNISDSDVKKLQEVFKHIEIQTILQNVNLEIILRTELLKFFQNSYNNPLVDINQINKYISVLAKTSNNINPFYDDNINYIMKYDLMNVKTDLSFFKFNQNILKHEMFNSAEIFLKNLNVKKATLINYIEDALIVPIVVYADRFIHFIQHLGGYEYIKLFEITFYFLQLKSLIFSKKDIFENYVHKEIGEFFIKVINLKRKKGYLLYRADYSQAESNQLQKDIETLSNPNYEILNYKAVFLILERNLKFLSKPKSKSLKEHFKKRSLNYNEGQIAKITGKLKKANYLTTNFENKILNLLIFYENEKQRLENSSFIDHLNEIADVNSKNFRIIFTTIVFFLYDKKLDSVNTTQHLWNLLRLLQFDTEEIQKDIKILFENKNVNLEKIFDDFCFHLVGLIFNRTNPSIVVNNENYYCALNIIKIFKYLCENHNNYFQEIFVKTLKIKFNFRENEEFCEEITVFAFILRALEKIFLISKYEFVDFFTKDEEITYFYDLIFVLNEFLIETIQGNTKENIESLSTKNENENFSNLDHFLLKILPILTNTDHNSTILYKIQKDLSDFILAFIEENNTSAELIDRIGSLVPPNRIFDIIRQTMNKLFLKLKGKDIYKYREIVFDLDVNEYFVDKFYHDETFVDNIEYELANRLFQYVKYVGNNEHKNKEAVNILNLINFGEKDKILLKINDTDGNFSNNIYFEKKQYEDYFVLEFFENITRTVEILLESNEKETIVFTLNPKTFYLSENTKFAFVKNVNRESRYTKTSALMENSQYFYDEINYNESRSKSNFFLRYLMKFNYLNVEKIVFFLSIIINFLIISSHKVTISANSSGSHRILNETDASGDVYMTNVNIAILTFALIQVTINGFIIVCWFIVRFPLNYLIEKKKYLKKFKIEEIDLTLWRKIQIVVFYSIIKTNELNAFMFNLIWEIIGICIKTQPFTYAIQLLVVINLSETLKNIIRSVTLKWKQLFLTSFFMIIWAYIFGFIGFLFFQEQYLPVIF